MAAALPMRRGCCSAIPWCANGAIGISALHIAIWNRIPSWMRSPITISTSEARMPKATFLAVCSGLATMSIFRRAGLARRRSAVLPTVSMSGCWTSMRNSDWRRTLAAGLIAAGGIAGLSAAAPQQDDGAARLRAALRTATSQLRDLQDQNAMLTAKQSEAERQRMALTQQLAAA